MNRQPQPSRTIGLDRERAVRAACGDRARVAGRADRFDARDGSRSEKPKYRREVIRLRIRKLQRNAGFRGGCSARASQAGWRSPEQLSKGFVEAPNAAEA